MFYRKIVVGSGLLDLLEPGDLVMADRRFTIKDFLIKQIKLNIPPLPLDKSQFKKDEVAYTRYSS